jgi:biotin transport system substrate-specific component
MEKQKLDIKDMALVSVFVALMTAGAFIRIPFPIIPITLQSFFCGLAAIVLGKKLGTLSQAIYLLLGLFGLPVFAQGGGISYVLKPSFGFLLGFIVGAYVTGEIISRFNAPKKWHYLLAVIAGQIAIYAFGIPYMYLILNVYLNKPGFGFIVLLSTNIPYFVKDCILSVVTAFIASTLVPLIRRL